MQAPDPPSSVRDRTQRGAPGTPRGASGGEEPAGPRLPTIAISSNKGGVGKTTVSANLAVYLRALREDLPVLIVGLDDQDILDRMFQVGPARQGRENLKHAWARRSLDGVIELGQYGVHFVPSPPDTALLKGRASDPLTLRRILDHSDWNGVVILDTKSDLEALTLNAIHAADRVVIPIADRASLREAAKTFRILERSGLGIDRGRVLFTLVDRRSRGDDGGGDLLHVLMNEVEAQGWPRFRTILSRSPRVESLISAGGRPHSILHTARGTAVHRQMREFATELMAGLGVDMSRGNAAPQPLSSAAPSLEPVREVEPRRGLEPIDWKAALLRGVWRRD